jgi:hypothetical protein
MKLRQIPALLVVGAAAAHAAAPNLIANPELEANLSGWTGQGGAISRVASDVFGRADSGSAQLTASLGTNVTLAQCVALRRTPTSILALGSRSRASRSW